MILTDYRFLLDVHETNSQISLSFKQGDTGRVLYITLTENGDIFNIPQNCVAVFTALKPDGTIIFNDCEINGNEIVYTHTAQTAAVSGKVDCELRLYGAGNTLLTSPHFTIFVHPTVYAEQIESKDEVNTLTALISEANTKLANGDFIPKVSIGTVETLPAGRAASVSIAGTPEAPVFNFGIPQGEYGQGEASIPDTELSEESIRTVQNRVITKALNLKANAEDVAQALNLKANAEDVAQALNLKANAEDVAQALDKKVDKEEGKGLSANDYSNEDKEKLSGIEEGANKYELPVGGADLGGVKNGGDVTIKETGSMNIKNGVVTGDKLAPSAVSCVYYATIDADWTGDTAPFVQEVTVTDLPESERIIADIILAEEWATAEAEDAEFAKIIRMVAAPDKLTVYANDKTKIPLNIKLVVLHGSGSGGSAATSDGFTLVDRTTGTAYSIYVDSGKLIMA